MASKTRMIRLAGREKRLSIALAVCIQYISVTERQTDKTGGQLVPSLSIASRGENRNYLPRNFSKIHSQFFNLLRADRDTYKVKSTTSMEEVMKPVTHEMETSSLCEHQ